MSEHIRLKHNAGQAEFVPTPAPKQTEAPKPDLTPLLGPIRKNYPQSTGRVPTTPQFASLADGINAELEADAAIRTVAAHEAMNTPKRLAIRLNEDVKNGKCDLATAQRLWALKYPGLDPLDAQ